MIGSIFHELQITLKRIQISSYRDKSTTFD